MEEGVRIKAVGSEGHGRGRGGGRGGGGFRAAVEAEGEGGGPKRARKGFVLDGFGGGGGEEAEMARGVREPGGEGASDGDARCDEHVGGYEEEEPTRSLGVPVWECPSHGRG